MGTVAVTPYSKNDGGQAIVALQEAVKNSKQSDSIHENSPKGDSQSNEATENAGRKAEGMIRTWKMSVEEVEVGASRTKDLTTRWYRLDKSFG